MKAKQWLMILVIGLASIQVQASIKIAVVDIRTALFTSNAAKEFSKGLVGKFSKQEQEVKKVQQEGIKLQAKLKKDSAIMSTKEKDDLVSKLNDKIKEFKYLKSKLDDAVNESKQQFIQDAKPKMDRILKSIIDKEKLDLVIPRQATIYSKPALDITAKVIEMLNKK
jgi:outer membrane protein